MAKQIPAAAIRRASSSDACGGGGDVRRDPSRLIARERLAAMSALPPKADIVERDCHVRFVPKADIAHRWSAVASCLRPASAAH
jgi:hypothetical protein